MSDNIIDTQRMRLINGILAADFMSEKQYEEADPFLQPFLAWADTSSQSNLDPRELDADPLSKVLSVAAVLRRGAECRPEELKSAAEQLRTILTHLGDISAAETL